MSDRVKANWFATPPAAFDIVSCWYPSYKNPGAAGPKLRPCFVERVLKGRSSGLFACDVVLGTTKLKALSRLGKDIIIQNYDEIGQIGLIKATRFDLDYRARLPWTEEFFGCWGGRSSPYLGSFTETIVKEYAYLMMKRQSKD